MKLTSTCLTIGLLTLGLYSVRAISEVSASTPATIRPVYSIPQEKQALLLELERRIVMYFWNEVFPETGISFDHTENRVGKVASTGFELVAICIGIERGWIPYDKGYERTELILDMFYDDPDDPNDLFVDGQYGLWWHFIDGRTGKMKPIDCVALCDSADFIGGALIAAQYFKGTPLQEKAQRICDNVQWDQFALQSTNGLPGILTFGWVPLHTSEGPYYEIDGPLPFGMHWLVDNSLLIYALALGSDTHPISHHTWKAYTDTATFGEYAGHKCAKSNSLFTRQVPHAFIRFSRKRDHQMEYFEDTVNALLADRAFNMNENNYPPQLWGLNDCFGLNSYTHSAPPGQIHNDGTIATTSLAGALPHIPGLSLEAIEYVYNNYSNQVWGKYGFSSSLNPQKDYYSPLFVGIELGPVLMLIENALSGMVWDLFMATDEMKNFVIRAGLESVIDDFELSIEAPAYATWESGTATLNRSTNTASHGSKSLTIETTNTTVTITGTLPWNDILEHYPKRKLLLSSHDFIPTNVTVIIDGETHPLYEQAATTTKDWTHHTYQFPQHGDASIMTGITVSGTPAGQKPAVDNIYVK